VVGSTLTPVPVTTIPAATTVPVVSTIPTTTTTPIYTTIPATTSGTISTINSNGGATTFGGAGATHLGSSVYSVGSTPVTVRVINGSGQSVVSTATTPITYTCPTTVGSTTSTCGTAGFSQLTGSVTSPYTATVTKTYLDGSTQVS
jgi:hypothetical protein